MLLCPYLNSIKESVVAPHFEGVMQLWGGQVHYVMSRHSSLGFGIIMDILFGIGKKIYSNSASIVDFLMSHPIPFFPRLGKEWTFFNLFYSATSAFLRGCKGVRDEDWLRKAGPGIANICIHSLFYHHINLLLT